MGWFKKKNKSNKVDVYKKYKTKEVQVKFAEGSISMGEKLIFFTMTTAAVSLILKIDTIKREDQGDFMSILFIVSIIFMLAGGYMRSNGLKILDKIYLNHAQITKRKESKRSRYLKSN